MDVTADEIAKTDLLVVPAKAPPKGRFRLVPEVPPAVWILFWGRLLSSTGFSLTFPFLAIYLHQQRGFSEATAGALMSLAGLSGALAQVFGGAWADRFGRKGVMFLSLVLRALSLGALSTCVFQEAGLLPLAAILVVGSFVGHLYEPASQAFVADIATREKQVQSYGLLRVGANAGFALGPAVGGLWAAEAFGWLLAAAAAVIFSSGALILFGIRESRRAPSRRDGGARSSAPLLPARSVLADGLFLKFCFWTVMIHAVMGQLITPLGMYATGRLGISQREVGWLFTLNGALVVFAQMPFSWFSKRFPLVVSLAGGCVLYGLGFGSVAFASGIFSLVVFVTVVTAGEMLVMPVSSTAVARLSPEDQRGRYQGVFGLAGHLGWCFGPLLGGVGLSALGASAAWCWLGIGALALLAAFVVWQLGNRLR